MSAKYAHKMKVREMRKDRRELIKKAHLYAK